MSIVIKVSTLFLLLASSLHSTVWGMDKERREEWPIVKGAMAKIEKNQHKVYYDPKNTSHILIYPECWLIRLDTKIVVMPNCTFEFIGETLYFDKTWRDSNGYVTGVEWGDPKMSNISFLSTIFRKPKFKTNSVSIWDGAKWIHIIGLSDVSEDVK